MKFNIEVLSNQTRHSFRLGLSLRTERFLEWQTLEEFCGTQAVQRAHLDAKLQRFSCQVRDTVMKSCEDTLYNFLHSAGFNVKVRLAHALTCDIPMPPPNI